MAMRQLSGRNSLRDIVENISAQAHRLYHLGSAKLSRSNVSRINENKPYALYEALFEGLVLLLIVWWFSAKQRPYMAVSAMSVMWYGIFRFFIEFYRVPDAHLSDDGGYLGFGWITMGQVLSVPMILAGLTMLILAYRNQSAPGDAN